MLKVSIAGANCIKVEEVNTIPPKEGVLVLKHVSTNKCVVFLSNNCRSDVIAAKQGNVEKLSSLFNAYVNMFENKNYDVYYYRLRANVYGSQRELTSIVNKLRVTGELIITSDVLSIKEYAPIVIETNNEVYYDMLIRSKMEKVTIEDLLSLSKNTFMRLYPAKEIVSVNYITNADTESEWYDDKDVAFFGITDDYQTVDKTLLPSAIMDEKSKQFIGYIEKVS